MCVILKQYQPRYSEYTNTSVIKYSSVSVLSFDHDSPDDVCLIASIYTNIFMFILAAIEAIEHDNLQSLQIEASPVELVVFLVTIVNLFIIATLILVAGLTWRLIPSKGAYTDIVLMTQKLIETNIIQNKLRH